MKYFTSINKTYKIVFLQRKPFYDFLLNIYEIKIHYVSQAVDLISNSQILNNSYLSRARSCQKSSIPLLPTSQSNNQILSFESRRKHRFFYVRSL